MKVKTYELFEGEMNEDTDGEWVRYEDYDDLKIRFREYEEKAMKLFDRIFNLADEMR